MFSATSAETRYLHVNTLCHMTAFLFWGIKTGFFIQMTTFNRPFRSLEAINGQFADKRSGSVRTTVWASTRCIGTTHCRGNTWEKYRQSKARNGKGTLCYCHLTSTCRPFQSSLRLSSTSASSSLTLVTAILMIFNTSSATRGTPPIF